MFNVVTDTEDRPDRPAVQVQDLVKRYAGRREPAVDGISLTVPRGQLFALLGPNGAGKTTTISILTTTLTKTSGQVAICGHDLDHDARRVRDRIGIIFQSPSLDETLSAEQNVRLHVALYGLYPYRAFYRWMPQDYRRRLDELGAVVGLQDDLHRPLRTFSGGMRRKLEVLRSLMHRPQVLFLDEPTTGLDPVSRAEVWAHLDSVRRQTGMTIFLTTHYLEEAEQADRVCVVDRGRVIADDTPRGLKTALLRRRAVLDAPDRTALLAELDAAGARPTGTGPFTVDYTTATIQPLLAEIATPLTLLDAPAPSLDEAYRALISRPDETAGAPW